MANLSISKAWAESSAFLGREARLLTPIALATFTVPAALFGWYNPSGDPNLASGGLGWPLTLVILILSLLGQMVIVGLSIGWSGSIGAAFCHAFKRLWGVIAAAFLVFLPLTIILVLVIAMLMAGAGLTDPAQVTPEALARMPAVGFVVLIATLIFLFAAVRMLPMSAVAMTETANPFRLLSRSWGLTRGNFPRLFATLFLILIASAVASMAVTAVAGSIMTLIAGKAEPYSVSALVIALADGAISAAISCISSVLVGRIYAQLSAADASVPDVSRER